MSQNNGIDRMLTVSCGKNDSKDFFIRWVEFLRPLHGLTRGEMFVLAAILRERDRLDRTISDKNIINSICLSENGRNKIMNEINMPRSKFNNYITKLKESKLLKSHRNNGKIDYYNIAPSIIPPVNDDNCKLLLIFDYGTI